MTILMILQLTKLLINLNQEIVVAFVTNPECELQLKNWSWLASKGSKIETLRPKIMNETENGKGQ